MNNRFKWWEAESFTFVRVPKTIISNPVYKGLSANAALLYGILLYRLSLSVKNKDKFTDHYGDVFVYCTLKDICETLSFGHDNVTKMLLELELYGLSSAADNKTKADLLASMCINLSQNRRIQLFCIKTVELQQQETILRLITYLPKKRNRKKGIYSIIRLEKLIKYAVKTNKVRLTYQRAHRL